MGTVLCGMQRRDILKRAGAATTVGILAGCLGRGGSGPGGSGSDETSTTTTTTGSTTNSTTTTGDTTKTTTSSSDGEVAVKSHSLKVLSAKCGQPKNEASVEPKDSKKQLLITGTIPGSDSCARPVLKRAKTDAKTGTFMVTVGTKKKKSGSVACSECITAIKYRATFTFAGPPPKSVQVTHESMNNSKVVAGGDGKSTTTTTGK